MNKFVPHHSVLAKNIFFEGRQPILIPELWYEIDESDKDIEQLINQVFIKTTDGNKFQANSEFVIIDSNFFSCLQENNLLSFTVFSDAEYLKDLPVFFEDEWSESISMQSMKLLGWTVNKYTEPAFLYGLFPIEPETDKKGNILGYKITNKDIVNNFGLINNYENAVKVANTNNIEDIYNEVWRPLAICVDYNTFAKIALIIKSQ